MSCTFIAPPAIAATMRLRLLVLALFAASAASAFGQVSARPGGRPQPPTEIPSPMVLEIPLPSAEELLSGGFDAGPETRRFMCDDVTVFTAKIELVDRRSTRRLDLSGLLRVRESHDKRVTVEVEALAGDERLAREVAYRVDAEERKNTPFRVSLDLPAEAEPSLLRLTVHVMKEDER